MLGTGAYLEELNRTKIGKFRLKQAVKLDDLSEKNWEKSLVRLT